MGSIYMCHSKCQQLAKIPFFLFLAHLFHISLETISCLLWLFPFLLILTLFEQTFSFLSNSILLQYFSLNHACLAWRNDEPHPPTGSFFYPRGPYPDTNWNSERKRSNQRGQSSFGKGHKLWIALKNWEINVVKKGGTLARINNKPNGFCFTSPYTCVINIMLYSSLIKLLMWVDV